MKRYSNLIVIGIATYTCIQMIVLWEPVTIQFDTSRLKRRFNDMATLARLSVREQNLINKLIAAPEDVLQNNQMETANGLQLHNGSFIPSFKSGRENVKYANQIDYYNEFEYPVFKIPEPKFPRQMDKKLFYDFVKGLKLLEDASIQERRGVVEIIRNGSFQNPYLCGWTSNYTLMHERVNHGVHYKKLCPLMPPEHNTFQHFFDGLLPKLAQVRDLLLDPDMKLLISKPRSSDKAIIHEFLFRLGINESQIVWEDNHSGEYTADYMVASCITPPIHPLLWQSMRNILDIHEKLSVLEQDARVILLTRAKSHNGGRNLINQREITDFLVERYGKDKVVVFSGGYSFNQSLSLFGSAKLIIGVHGGAFYNLNFAPKSVKILEIMPYNDMGYPKGLAVTIFWSMASMIGQEYWRLFSKSVKRNNDVQLNTTLLEDTLSSMNM